MQQSSGATKKQSDPVLYLKNKHGQLSITRYLKHSAHPKLQLNKLYFFRFSEEEYLHRTEKSRGGPNRVGEGGRIVVSTQDEDIL